MFYILFYILFLIRYQIFNPIFHKQFEMPNIDRQYKENIRAKLRLKIKTLLKRYRYPPDEQITAVKTVLQQADTLGEELVASKFFMFHQENRS